MSEYAHTKPGLLVVTEQYIIGELSVLLVQLEVVAPDEESACEFARLRGETERAPFETLPNIALEALRLIRGPAETLLREVTSGH